jgi:hypothetical protein
MVHVSLPAHPLTRRELLDAICRTGPPVGWQPSLPLVLIANCTLYTTSDEIVMWQQMLRAPNSGIDNQPLRGVPCARHPWDPALMRRPLRPDLAWFEKYGLGMPTVSAAIAASAVPCVMLARVYPGICPCPAPVLLCVGCRPSISPGLAASLYVRGPCCGVSCGWSMSHSPHRPNPPLPCVEVRGYSGAHMTPSI